MLRLPKNILQHPRLAALEAFFTANEQPLRQDGKVVVSRWPADEAVAGALRAALGTGHLIQGLELIAQTLDREEKGLRAVREKTGAPAAGRLSRLLLLSNDGSERFYRDAEAVLHRHGQRTWGCLLDATAERLGREFSMKGNPVKALLIDDKTALGLFLATLADRLPPPA